MTMVVNIALDVSLVDRCYFLKCIPAFVVRVSALNWALYYLIIMRMHIIKLVSQWTCEYVFVIMRIGNPHISV